MAHPKRKQSKTRTAKRRTHDKAVAPTIALCPNCGAWHIYHTVCPECGYYRGKIAIEKAAANNYQADAQTTADKERNNFDYYMPLAAAAHGAAHGPEGI